MASGNTNFGNSAGNGTVGADGFLGPLTGNVNGVISGVSQLAIVAAGTNQQSVATAVTPGEVVVITVGATTRAVRLSVNTTNARYEVFNGTATAMKVYPATNAAIGATATNGSVQILARKGTIFLYRNNTTVVALTGA